jgi:glyoxalase family protein
VGESGRRIRLSAGERRPGHFIDVAYDPEARPMVNGLGTVHHVAMAVATEREQLDLRETLLANGCKVTEVRDRCYFKSIYFREPGGVLFELATIEPGFTADEPVNQLGDGLKLPPWEEAYRSDIESALAPISS